jgi:hypothetical protein
MSLTNSIEQSHSSESNSRLARQEFPLLLYNRSILKITRRTTGNVKAITLTTPETALRSDTSDAGRSKDTCMYSC